ncbi:unnamed protein product [Cylicostephanus goldi]|uniref:Methylated-DNA--protein-cysteine methyltransferase n=1 Tax=Cylicostephanus goldi TaxID=71465 RepID=A0A3P7QTJ7_CYLGO|nr:unnamed protein product [Cylicostephanus goldi]
MHGVYAVVDTPCGKMFVSEIENALCAVSFNPDIDDAIRILHFSYPLVQFTEGHVSSAENVRFCRGFVLFNGRKKGEILRLLNGEESTENIRISKLVFMRCSEFQRKVYEHLMRIPRGSTKSYAEVRNDIITVAKSIGHPTAYRAVARACRDNFLAVVIPCHRVVTSDGSLRGYRWGIEVKKKLLEMERKK